MGAKHNLLNSSLGIVPPRTRLNPVALTPYVWLEERGETDGAEGLWRIHDKLYDFTSFINYHPGGSDWIVLTKGTDITEAFESHHISQAPEEMLQKYYIKPAQAKRNFPFTFHEDGFYRTLKREIRKSLKTIPKELYPTSDMYSDIMFTGLLIFSLLSVRYWNYVLAVIAGVILGLLTVAGHNYIHRKSSFRMFYFQFSLLQVRDWRVLFLLRLVNYKTIKPVSLSGLLLPICMYIFGTQSLFHTLLLWEVILSVGSFVFTAIGLNAAHHHPDVFHDGDTPRSLESYDWGLNQLDAVMDRTDITGSDFLVLTSFGDHALHHLFPTLDHSLLKHLYPTLEMVTKQFDVHLRMTSQWGAILGGFQQLMKIKPNPFPPDLNNKKYLLR